MEAGGTSSGSLATKAVKVWPGYMRSCLKRASKETKKANDSQAMKTGFHSNGLGNTEQPVGHVPKDFICTTKECAVNEVEMSFNSKNVTMTPFLVQFVFLRSTLFKGFFEAGSLVA